MADAAISALFDKAQETTHLKVCELCFGELPDNHSRRKFCFSCSEQREANRQRRRRNKGVLGSPFNCNACGLEFPIKRGGQKYCDDCRRDVSATQQRQKRKKERRDAGLVVFGESISCVNCGSGFIRKAAKHFRCEKCAADFLKKYQEEYRNKTRPKKEKKPKEKKEKIIGSIFKCADCGKDTVKLGAKQKRCSDCQTALRKKRDAAYKQKLRKDPEIREKLNDKAREKPRTDALRAYVRKWEKNRRETDPHFAFHARMKAMIGNALREKKAGRRWESLVGYTCSELMEHLERQFLRGMTWENRGEWEVDHIIPVASFNFTCPEDEDFKACWSLTNLRPLWKKLNRDKWYHRIYLI